jgi:methionyl aminopeptidase
MSNSGQYLGIFRENGRKIAAIRGQLVDFAQIHPNLEEIETQANRLIEKAGGEPAFKRVPGYRWATCINVNDQIVHHIPTGTLKPGDVVTIDTGMYYQGTTTDCATTFVMGQASGSQTHFLNVGQKALRKAISLAKPGNQVKAISQAMQRVVEKAGYSVVRTLTGHGIGQTMHEDPQIPCYVSSDPGLRTVLKSGMVLAVEVMYMMGDWPLVEDGDGWTLRTADSSLSAVFEDDVIVTPRGPQIITALD